MKLGLEDADKVIDFFVYDVFGDISDDFLFNEYFCQYFKSQILLEGFSSEKLFLSDDEKTLQYAGRNTVEPLAEYMFLIAKHDSRAKKRHYAEKGATFAVVQPSLQTLTNSQREYYVLTASNFYDVVSSHSEHKEMEVFFDFLSETTPEMVSGLEQILEGIKNTGKPIVEKLYAQATMLYLTETDSMRSEQYARGLIGFSRKLGVDVDELPLKKEHYKFIFE